VSKSYDYALAITSQFPFCSIPLRLDSYSRCQFACRYCFASARGGSALPSSIKVADPKAFARRLERLAGGDEPRSVLDEMLRARIPIHFGGLSDPFMPMEGRSEVSLGLLKVLRDHSYPTVVSTKSTLCIAPSYIEIFATGRFVVQVSLPTISDDLAKRVDAGAPTSSERLRAVEQLSLSGVAAACRLQPLLDSGSAAEQLIAACSGAGARQVAVEHLKLAIDNDAHRRSLSAAVGTDLMAYYQGRAAKRVGREWILPVADRLEAMLALRSMAHASGMLFGAADNDLLHLSDGASCCSSVDQLGLGTTYRFTFTHAIKSHCNGRISFAGIANEWRPSRSVARYVNSKSRIARGNTEDYIRAHWNGFRHGSGLESFHGVERCRETDADGFAIYKLRSDVRKLVDQAGSPA
jgi:DNA repair photolyase